MKHWDKMQKLKVKVIGCVRACVHACAHLMSKDKVKKEEEQQKTPRNQNGKIFTPSKDTSSEIGKSLHRLKVRCQKLENLYTDQRYVIRNKKIKPLSYHKKH